MIRLLLYVQTIIANEAKNTSALTGIFVPNSIPTL